MSCGEQEVEVLNKDIHNPWEVDLVNLQGNPEDDEESNAVGDRPNETEGLELNNFNEMSNSDIIKRDFLDEVTRHNTELRTENFDQNPQDCDETIHTKNNVSNHTTHLKTSKCDIRATSPKTTWSMEHCDLVANTVCESDDSPKNCSLDFQTKRFGLCLPKNNGTRRGKRKKKEQRSRKCGRLQPISHELEFVEEEDLSEKEESSEEDNLDNSFHYSGSKDGLDHRKERHQYVSDKLDPDVLHLLEMHLRKQQLVDIKEEGEEEMLDVHINTEKSRSDSYKLLRNIPPVLDMVLEEPELEHAGDLLEEDSKTPSDVDSDDSGNVYSMEMCLMESLQHDLMSKSSKIDKHEIATILQGPECKSKQNKIKPSSHSECKSKHGNSQNKDLKAQEEHVRHLGELQVIQEDGPEDDGSGGVPDDVEDDTVEDIIHMPLQPESYFSDSLKDAPEQLLAVNDNETPILEDKDITEYFQAEQSSEPALLDVASNAPQQNISEPDTEASDTKLLDSINSDGSETAPLDFSKAGDASGLPCPTLEPNALCSEATLPSEEEQDSCYPVDGGDFRMENDSSEQTGGVQTSQEINLTDVKKDLKVIKTNVTSQTESSFPEALFRTTADMNTLHEDLKQKILSLLEKAHAADCRSSHLQAEAELLFKESIELRSECKSLSKEAAELLSIFTQQEVLHGHQTIPSQQEAGEDGSLSTSDTNPRDKETLSFVGKRTFKKKKKRVESQLHVLSKKYSFLRQEAPEIMRELHDLQQDLKNLPSHHNKPFGFLYKWLWGGLITGGAMLLFWWNAKQLG